MMHSKLTKTLLLMVLATASGSMASAGAPQAIHYQGYLTNADGNPLDDTVEMEFRLYAVEVAGEAFWTTPEAVAVDVENGVFRVSLAPVTAEQLAGGDVWLGITVVPADEGEPAVEMEPRLKVLSVPYALVAEHAATADVAGEAGAVTNVDFSTFATGDDVQGVLGVCIQEADLTDALQGYCAGPCYGDAEVELFVTENGYVTFDALAQWVADNVETGPDEDALAAYLAASGYMTEADLLWFLGEAGYPAADDVVLRDGTKSLEGDWDVGGNQLLNLVIHNAASDTPPEIPNAGQLWWDTTEKMVKVYDGEAWKTVGGGDVAFASECDTIDGLDSTAFEAAGAVASHEAAYGHLSAEQLATLTGGAESNADALHTHDMKGGLPNVNPDLLTSVFTKKYCSTDTPKAAPGDFGQVLSSIEVADAGSILSAQLEIHLSHSAPETLVPTLTSPGVEVKLAEVFQLDGTGDWELDVTGQLKKSESSGEWKLKILDMGESDGVAILEDWCLTIKFLSAEVVDVDGKLTQNGTDVLVATAPGAWVELSLVGTIVGHLNRLHDEGGFHHVPTGFQYSTCSNWADFEQYNTPEKLVDVGRAFYDASGHRLVYAGVVYDELDGTADPARWSQAGGDALQTSEVAGEYVQAQTSSGYLDSRTARLIATDIDLNPELSSWSEALFRFDYNARTPHCNNMPDANWIASVLLCDEAGVEVVVWQTSGKNVTGSKEAKTSTLRLLVDTSSGKCKVWDTADGAPTVSDIGPLSGSERWRLVFRDTVSSQCNNPSWSTKAWVRVHPVVYVSDSVVPETTILTASYALDGPSGYLFYPDFLSGGAELIVSGTYDGGETFQPVKVGKVHQQPEGSSAQFSFLFQGQASVLPKVRALGLYGLPNSYQ